MFTEALFVYEAFFFSRISVSYTIWYALFLFGNTSGNVGDETFTSAPRVAVPFKSTFNSYTLIEPGISFNPSGISSETFASVN